MHHIIRNIYIGQDASLQSLQKNNITSVLMCHAGAYHKGIKYSKLEIHNNIEYFFDTAIEFIDTATSGVLVAGEEYAEALVAAWLVKQGMTPVAAFSVLQSRYPASNRWYSQVVSWANNRQ